MKSFVYLNAQDIYLIFQDIPYLWPGDNFVRQIVDFQSFWDGADVFFRGHPKKSDVSKLETLNRLHVASTFVQINREFYIAEDRRVGLSD